MEKTTILNKVQSNKDLLIGLNFDKINKALNTEKLSNKKLFNDSVNTGKLMYQANEFIKTKQGKQALKVANLDNCTKDEIFLSLFDYKSKQSVYNYITLGNYAINKSEILSEYLNSTRSHGLVDFLKFIKDDSDKATDSDSDSDSEESKVDKKPENLKISVGKENKITIKGQANEQILSLIMQELQGMLEKIRNEKPTAKVA